MKLSNQMLPTQPAQLHKNVVKHAKPVLSTGVTKETARGNDKLETKKSSTRAKQQSMKSVNEHKNIAIIGMQPVACIGIEALLKTELDLQATIWPFQSAAAMNGRSSNVDLVISELNGSGALGIEKQFEIARNICGADTSVLILSEKDEMSFGPMCIAAGAQGFVSKSASLEIITQAIETVLAGKRYIGPELANSPWIEEEIAGLERHLIYP